MDRPRRKLTYSNVIITGAKIAPGAITADKLAPGVAGTEKVVVNSAPPSAPAPAPGPSVADIVKGSRGTLHEGQEAPIFTYGPFTITARCEAAKLQLAEGTFTEERFLISSSTPHSVFASDVESGPDLGPETSAEARVIGYSLVLRKNQSSFQGEGPGTVSVSASAAAGQAFSAFIGAAADEGSGTCWYWLTANVIS
jgi:hypothetical protein